MVHRDVIISNGSLETRYGYYSCEVCKIHFKLNDAIYTYMTKKDYKIYHKECWESKRY